MKEYLGLDVPTTLKTWTVMETIISVVALGVVLVLGFGFVTSIRLDPAGARRTPQAHSLSPDPSPSPRNPNLSPTCTQAMLILDAHLDLSMNAIEWNRDLSRPIDEIRQREAGMTDRPDRGRGTVSFDELRRGGVGVVVATQIARYVKRSNRLPGWHSPEQAWAMTQAQLAWYREMERRGRDARHHDARRAGRARVGVGGGSRIRWRRACPSATCAASRAPTRW